MSLEKLLWCFRINVGMDCQKLFAVGKEEYIRMRGSAYGFSNLFPFLEQLCTIYKVSHLSKNYLIFYKGDIRPLHNMLRAFDYCFQKIGIFGLNAEVARRMLMHDDESDIMDVDGAAKVDISDENISGGLQIYSMPYFLNYPFYRSNENNEYFDCVIHSARLVYDTEFLERLDQQRNGTVGSR